MDTVSYCEELLERFGKDRRFYPFISPLLPYIEPGSRAFNNPEKFGYANYTPTLENCVSLMRKSTWAQTLGYATNQMDRETLVEVTYEATIALNHIHEKHGLLTSRARRKEENRLMRELDDIRTGRFRRKFWLQGESSLYTPGLRGSLKKMLSLRLFGILRETLKGWI
jgi:hypothetical protein